MPPLPDLDALRLLLLVRDRGSLTAAAAELGVSQPAASKRMSALERRWKVTLLDRTRRGSALTPAGTLVCGLAQRVLDEVHALEDGVASLRHDYTANLVVAASLTVAEHLLPAWLGELRRENPGLHVGLEVTNSAHVCELVEAKAADLGFVEAPRPTRGLRSRTVARDRLVLAVRPDHGWAGRRRPVGPHELARTPLVSRERGSGTRDTVEQAMAAHGATLAPPLLELGSSEAVRSAVIAGAGPALVSELVVAGALARGVLVEVPTTGLELGRNLRAVWRTGTRPTRDAARLLAIAVRDHVSVPHR
ncbi:LysR family transcriptional regulator [Saccharomonospora xinjiangensis]|uniref:LysR family transcriptional regulator n=1 Tax=Saccharomonospora xinjiangensis TaxID=75294 RepID=UPI0010701953|nr:LysR family transcriptional regulator [Saccharomonospora xinjiangensis]QBQ59973.1 HTH-type transcriptional regulator CysL [Saccharomonospora xinjiangensis]